MPYTTDRPDYAERENAVSLLDAAFRAAGLKPPTGLSPVYRETDGAVVGVEVGAMGLFHVRELIEALLELTAHRGNVSEIAQAMPEIGLSNLTGERLEALGVIPAVAALPRGVAE
ncbi:hypothetical protein [Kitasatospora griseola]|uniref:hypothetical protein n=1 Tax=Kitasatospora griseola TaxID=2064 RepID=UPI0038010DA2